MNKLLLICLLSSSLFAFQPGEIIFEPKIGICSNSSSSENSFDLALKGEGRFGLEAYYRTSPKTDIGLGVMYSVLDSKETEDDDSLVRIPVYLSAKAHFGNDWLINPYLKLVLGYQFIPDTDLKESKNNDYYGAVFGLDIKNFTFETFIYVYSNGEYIKFSPKNFQSTLGYTASIGYRF